MGFESRINGYGNEIGNGVIYGYDDKENGNFNGNGGDSSLLINGFSSSSNVFSSLSSSSSSSSSTSSSSSSSSLSPRRYIEHHVTKMDTLAGVAIRYGVEIADIKKLNGLVSDLQMFALKTLQIPRTGKHPPSQCLSSDDSAAGPSSSNHTPFGNTRSDVLDSFQSLRLTPDRKLSPAMCSLRDFYGLNGLKNSSEGCEMVLYGRRSSTGYLKDESFSRSSSLMNPPLSQHRRSQSMANGFQAEKDGSTNHTPEKLLKEENVNGGWFSGITGKGLALRTKAGSRTNLASEADGFPCGLGESIVAESSSGVRKCSSTPSLQDQDGNSGLSIWSPSKWSLKPDLQAALSNPFFDGLPKPISGRKSKAARD